MSFALRGLFATAWVATGVLVVACGGDDEAPGGGEPDGSSLGGAGGSGASPSGGSGATAGMTGGGGSGAQAGTGGSAGGGGTGATDGGGSCSLGCVNGTCVVSGGSESCACDSVYSGALCDDISAPPSTGVVLWLDADDDSTTGGGSAGPIARWEDKSGASLIALAGPLPPDGGVDAGDGGIDASVPPPAPVDAGDASPEAGLGDDIPHLVVNTTSGRRLVRFDGNDCMRIGVFDGLTDQASYTIVLVGYGTPTRQPLLSGTTAAGPGLLIETSATSYRFLHRMPFGSSGGDSLPGTQAFSQSAAEVATFWRSASTTEHALLRGAGTADSIAVTAAAFDADVELAIGCLSYDAPGRYLVGEIGEILIYAGDLPAADRRAAADYLSRKWLATAL